MEGCNSKNSETGLLWYAEFSPISKREFCFTMQNS